MDQSILNYIIYHLKLFDDNIIKSNNKEGPLMTIGITIYRKNICLDSEYNILNDKGQIAAVVHQYDRSLNLTKILRNKFDNIKKLKINSNSYIIIIIVFLNSFLIIYFFFKLLSHKKIKSRKEKRIKIHSLNRKKIRKIKFLNAKNKQNKEFDLIPIKNCK